MLAEVRAALKQPAARVLWAGKLDGKRTALAIAAGQATWLAAEERTQTLQVQGEFQNGSPKMLALPYESKAQVPHVPHLLVVVPRGARVEASRGEITREGRVRRTWWPVRVEDGAVDLAATDDVTRGGLTVRSDAAPGVYAFTRPRSYVDDSYLAPGLRSDTGPGLAVARRGEAQTAMTMAASPLGAPASALGPRVEYSSSLPGGGAVVVATAGLRGQGRLLVVRAADAPGHDSWSYRTTVPATGPPAVLGWRVPLPGGRWLAGWLTEPGSAFRVRWPSRAGQGDGTRFGWIEVGAREDVTITGTDARGQRVDLKLGPEAAERGGDPEWMLPGEER